MQVTEIDSRDSELLWQFWRSGRDGLGFGRPHAVFAPFEAVRVLFQEPDGALEQRGLVATVGGELVGSCRIMLPLLDNTTLAYLTPVVDPESRRQGIGTALLEAAHALVAGLGRTTAVMEVAQPLDGDSPGMAFAEHHGYTTGIVDLHRVLEIPVGADRLDALSTACAPHHVGYELVLIGDRVPDELVEGFCALESAFNTEAPSGELDLEAEVWDVDRLRRAEARRVRQGRHSVTTVALAADGSVVASTDLMVEVAQPGVVMQGGTLVLPDHRGHRLGLATKVANLRALEAQYPRPAKVHSWNAESNGPMVAINDTLGFRPVERLAELQRRL